MVPNPIFMKTIQPELCTLASPGVPLPRQAYSSSHAEWSIWKWDSNCRGRNTTTEERERKREQRGDCSLEMHCVPIHGATPSSEDNYMVMSPVGTLSHSLQGRWGIPDHSGPEGSNKNGFERSWLITFNFWYIPLHFQFGTFLSCTQFHSCEMFWERKELCKPDNSCQFEYNESHRQQECIVTEGVFSTLHSGKCLEKERVMQTRLHLRVWVQ